MCTDKLNTVDEWQYIQIWLPGYEINTQGSQEMNIAIPLCTNDIMLLEHSREVHHPLKTKSES